MQQNESMAHELCNALRSAGVHSLIEGGGVHWQVNTDEDHWRLVVIHCFWYETFATGLSLQMNSSNARASLGVSNRAYQGPEYCVILKENNQSIADGRLRGPADQVIHCTRLWLQGADLGEIEKRTPFINAKSRIMRLIASQLDSRLTYKIFGDPSYELWVYGDNRSCKIMTIDGSIYSYFYLAQAQVAQCVNIPNVGDVISAWLIDGVSISHLSDSAPGILLERHTEVLEINPARWHWLHMRDRIADPDDILNSLRPLLEMLEHSPVATSFYTFSSLNRLCFSASSHFPWVNEGLPVIAPASEQSCYYEGQQYSFAQALEKIEDCLKKYPIKPFFGSAPHHELIQLKNIFKMNQSSLEPKLVQQQQWYRLIVEVENRCCEVNSTCVTFFDNGAGVFSKWVSIDDAALAIIQYVENKLPLKSVLDNPRRIE